MELERTEFFTRLHDHGLPLSENDLSRFESELAMPLPPSYRRFLALRNGGRFYQPVACRIAPNDYSEDCNLATVYGLLNPDEGAPDLRHEFKLHQGRIPAGMLPIGEDGHNLVLIDLKDEVGPIYLWIRDDEMFKLPEENRIPVAPSFLEMAARCTVDRSLFANLQSAEPFRAIEHFELARLREHLERGLDPNMVNERGSPLLLFACQELNYDAAELLLSFGSDPNCAGGTGKTALQCAAGKGALDLMRLLLANGASRCLPNNPAVRIIDTLKFAPRQRVAELLRE